MTTTYVELQLMQINVQVVLQQQILVHLMVIQVRMSVLVAHQTMYVLQELANQMILVQVEYLVQMLKIDRSLSLKSLGTFYLLPIKKVTNCIVGS
jgi:hypothetical protein